MTACVIGGGGFIGGYLVDALVATGREVLVLGRRNEPPAGLNARATYLACDYGDGPRIRKYLSNCEELIDLAYATVPQTSFINPIFDLQAHLFSAVKFLEECKSLPRLRKLLVTSSGGTVYGTATRLPILEEDRTAPLSPYGITKLAIERYALMFHHLNDLPVTIVRPANAYGRGQKPFTGQGFIATAIGRILRGESVTIFGESGTVRDYVHVKDVALGMISALEYGLVGEAYNLGTGVGCSNREVLAKLEPIVNKNGFSIEIEYATARIFDVAANVLSYSKVFSHTKWQPRISFEDGLFDMWEGARTAPFSVSEI